MALFNSYGSQNKEQTEALDTVWKAELITELKPIGSGAYNWFRWWRYTRTRTKTYNYKGMNLSAAKTCAIAMHELYNRKLLPQIWTYNGSGSWTRTAQPGPNDFIYQDCAKVRTTREEGDDWRVDIDVDESMVYNHTPVNVSGKLDQTLPDRWHAYEENPTSQAFDNYFTGWGSQLDYEE